jgi:hypothetical protein
MHLWVDRMPRKRNTEEAFAPATDIGWVTGDAPADRDRAQDTKTVDRFAVFHRAHDPDYDRSLPCRPRMSWSPCLALIELQVTCGVDAAAPACFILFTESSLPGVMRAYMTTRAPRSLTGSKDQCRPTSICDPHRQGHSAGRTWALVGFGLNHAHFDECALRLTLLP